MDSSSRAAHPETSYFFGHYELHAHRGVLLRDGETIRVGSRALELLTLLVERAGDTVSKQDLLQRGWPDVFVHEDNLKVNIAGLRRVLDADNRPSMIVTVPGRGYRFVAPVRFARVEPEPPGGRSILAGLPPSPTLFGRAEDIATVTLALRAGGLVTIVGAGGIGKTVVAIAAAQNAASMFADGVTFIDLTKVNDGGLVPALVASSLGMAANGPEPLAGVIHALRTQRRLLIFDNCEHVLPAAAAAVEQLTRNASGLGVLATSREPLAVRVERLHRLDALPNAPAAVASAADAISYPAVELFVRRAAECAGYAFNDADAPVVAELCRRLDGIPLAIELAATQTAACSVGELLGMLEDRFRLLSYGPRQFPPRQQTLLATLDWSYNLLSESEAALLPALAVFMGPLDVEAAMAVAPVDADPLEIVDTLSRLGARSLLTRELQAGAVHYRLLETTRAYCLERLQRTGALAAVRRRHAEHVCSVLERATADWMERPASEWGTAHGRILDDLRAAIAWAGQEVSGRSLMIRLTAAGCVLWNHLSLLEECRHHAARALAEIEAAGLAGSAVEMTLQAALASATMFTRGLVEEAADASRRALEIAQRLGDTDITLRSLKTLAMSEVLTGRPLLAVGRMEQFAEVAATRDPPAFADGERMLAIAEYYLGRLESSRHRLEYLWEQARESGGVRSNRFEVERSGSVGCALATVQWLTGLPETAVRTAARTVELGILSGHEVSLSNTLALAGQIALWTGRRADAERYIDMLGELSPHSIDMWRRPFSLYARGVLAAEVEAAEGTGLIRQAIAEFESANLLIRTPHYLGTLAMVLADRGQLGEAADTIEVAVHRAGVQQERWCVPELLRIKASILNRQKLPDAAELLLLSAISQAAEMGALSWQLRSADALARLWLDQGKVAEARRLLSPIIDLCTEGAESRDLAAVRGLLRDRTAAEGSHRRQQAIRGVHSRRG